MRWGASWRTVRDRYLWDVAVAAGAGLLLLAAYGRGGEQAPLPDTDVPTHLSRAQALYADGDPDLALVELGKAVGRDPTNAGARYELGRRLVQRGHLDAGAAELAVALERQPTAAAAIELGLVELKRDRPDAAADRFRLAAELDPDSAVAWLDLGIALLRAERPAEAVPACERAVKANPANPDARHNLGFAYRLNGQPERAAAVLEELLRTAPERTISLYELASAYADLGRAADAVAALDRLLGLQPGHGPARALRQRLAP